MSPNNPKPRNNQKQLGKKNGKRKRENFFEIRNLVTKEIFPITVNKTQRKSIVPTA